MQKVISGTKFKFLQKFDSKLGGNFLNFGFSDYFCTKVSANI